PKWLALGGELNANISCLGNGSCPKALAAGVKVSYAGFTSSVAQAVRPFPQYSAVYNEYELAGFSTYNALQVKLEKRFSADFNILVSYSASKSLDAAGSQLAAYFSAGAQDSFHCTAEKSVRGNDIPPHTLPRHTYD